MTCAILGIGDELLTGHIANTNAAKIAACLRSVHIDVRAIDNVRDDKADIVRAIQRLATNHDLVITTGGLGPTMDDITRQVVADVTGHQLTVYEPALQRLEKVYRDRNLPVTETMRLQASMPEGATPLTNSVGTALGFIHAIDECQVIVLPGVPSEMEAMLDEHVLPMLRELGGGRSVQVSARFLGLTESQLNAEIVSWHQGLGALTGQVRLGMQVRFPEILLHFYLSPDIENDFRAQLEQFTDQHPHFVDFETHLVEDVIHNVFMDYKLTLGLAESCTGGYISSRLLARPDASQYFKGSLIAYSNEVKVSALGVQPLTIEKHGAVSAETALEMALGTKQNLNVDVAMATTGVLGPAGGTPTKPVGTAYVAITSPQGEHVQKFHLRPKRSLGRVELTCRSLFLLRDTIRSTTKK